MRRVKKFVISWSLFVLLIAGFGGLFLWWLFSPVDSKDIAARHITIPKGESVRGIADQLEEAGVIRSSWTLLLVLRGKEAAGKIQSGSYELSPSMTVGMIADELLSGPKDAWITLLEGWRLEEISEELTKVLGLRYFNPSEFLELAKPYEGQLFPDTYLFPKQAAPSLILNSLRQNFEIKYAQAVSEVGTPSISREEVLILASLLEREAKSYQDKRIVAGILMNRLEHGIALQVDATLQYAKGYDAQKKTWWPQPRASDKDLRSPFNTYKNRGLPPAPICNPGLNAIKAAIDPIETDYIYYLTDNQGKMHYAQTLEQHNANVNRYLR